MKQSILKNLGNAKWLMSLNRYLYVLSETGTADQFKIEKSIQMEATVKYTVFETEKLIGITNENDKLLKFFEYETLLSHESEDIDITKLVPKY